LGDARQGKPANQTDNRGSGKKAGESAGLAQKNKQNQPVSAKDKDSGAGDDKQNKTQAGQGNSSGSNKQGCKSAGLGSDGRTPSKPKQQGIGGTVDDHSVWQQVQKDPAGFRAVIENVIREATLEVGMDKVPDQFKGAGLGALAGDTPGEDQCELRGDEQGKLDWQRLLRRYVGQIFQVRPVFTRPPRRFPDLVGIVPGKRRQPDRPKIMAVIDTSGSVTPELLELIDAELTGLARHHEIKVVECDCAVHAVYDYRRLKSVSGQGGTDFRPPLKRRFLRKHRPDLVVLFTDGEGPAPAKPPRVPVIWCLTPKGAPPAEWGRKIQM
jgi:predicted metal-dependent peptidase